MRALLAIALLASSAFADEPKKDVPKAYTAYPGSRQLCYQHISGNKMHIMWSSHATKDALAKVVEHYEKGLGKKAAKADAHGARLIEVDADRHVTIYPVASNDKLPSCETKPKAGEQTIVMISTAAR
jgi:hypothetical protein